jgi:hypothetical protein
MKLRATWTADTVEPAKGTLGWAQEVRPTIDGEIGLWIFQPDGDEGGFACGEGDFAPIGD